MLYADSIQESTGPDTEAIQCKVFKECILAAAPFNHIGEPWIFCLAILYGRKAKWCWQTLIHRLWASMS